MCLDNDEAPIPINSVELDDWDELWQYILTSEESDEPDMTVSRLMECLTEDHPDDPDFDGEETEVVVRITDDDDDACLKFLDDSGDRIFF